jgi:hypothetical protein
MSTELKLKNGTSIKFESYNPHPYIKDRDLNDCFIRAICKTTGLEYITIYNNLYNMAKSKYLQMNDPNILNPYCRRYGFRLYYPDNITISDFISSHPSGTYMICSKKHIAAYIDGILYDSDILYKNIDKFLDSKLNKYYVKYSI